MLRAVTKILRYERAKLRVNAQLRPTRYYKTVNLSKAILLLNQT
jgi:hypothetical protein